MFWNSEKFSILEQHIQNTLAPSVIELIRAALNFIDKEEQNVEQKICRTIRNSVLIVVSTVVYGIWINDE